MGHTSISIGRNIKKARLLFREEKDNAFFWDMFDLFWGLFDILCNWVVDKIAPTLYTYLVQVQVQTQ